jgi:hypothetical protein
MLLLIFSILIFVVFKFKPCVFTVLYVLYHVYEQEYLLIVALFFCARLCLWILYRWETDPIFRIRKNLSRMQASSSLVSPEQLTFRELHVL